MTIYLIDGIKYPAPVAKAYKAQQDAEAALNQAIVAQSQATTAHATALEKDRVAMEEAARAGTGAPKTLHASQTAREVEYADTRHAQARDALTAAGFEAGQVVATHAGDLVPLMIENARQAAVTYDDTMERVRALISEAARTMTNAASGLNLLHRRVPYAEFRVNFVPPTVSLPTSASGGNLLQIADRLEQAREQHNNPVPRAEHWPSTGQTWAHT
jgi:hypothetical protein